MFNATSYLIRRDIFTILLFKFFNIKEYCCFSFYLCLCTWPDYWLAHPWGAVPWPVYCHVFCTCSMMLFMILLYLLVYLYVFTKEKIFPMVTIFSQTIPGQGITAQHVSHLLPGYCIVCSFNICIYFYIRFLTASIPDLPWISSLLPFCLVDRLFLLFFTLHILFWYQGRILLMWEKYFLVVFEII